MAISLFNLFSATQSLYRLSWIAGNRGGDNCVSWMYYTEDLSTLDFIRGGELVLTTGMSIGRKEDNLGKKDSSYVEDYLMELVHRLLELKACGLIVNVGKYIPEIPGLVIDFCNQMDFPLLILPWEIHTVDIMQDYGNRIVKDRQKVLRLEQSLRDAIFNPGEFRPHQLENTVFGNSDRFSLVLMGFPGQLREKNQEEVYRYIHYSFNIKSGLRPDEFCFFIHGDFVIYVFKGDCSQACRKIENAARKDPYFKSEKISVSSVCGKVEELAEEYNHAFLAMKLCDRESLFSSYDDLGFFQILGEVKDKKVLEKTYDKVLGKLSIFKGDKLDDYLNTLKLYLNSSGKVQKTAEENFTHRNTVNYRIKKICQILGVDLGDGHTRFMIQVALFIREMLEKTECR